MKHSMAAAFAVALVCLAWTNFGCKKAVYFEIAIVNRREVMLEKAVVASSTGRQLGFGYLSKDADTSYLGGWQIFTGETLTVTWVEGGKPYSSQITLASTNVGPKGIQIEIKADGTLTARPGWHSL
jgi:hypothetical protein